MTDDDLKMYFQVQWNLGDLEQVDAFDRLALRTALTKAVQQIENIRASQAKFFQILGSIQQKYNSINPLK